MIIEIIVISLVAYLINIPLGRWRTKYKRLSLMWWLLIHASIPVIVGLRVYFETPGICIPLYIGMAILGQLTGVWTSKRKPKSYIKMD